ncbi:MAG: hypothetical protein Q6373_005235 [Candidatus Sigynarchaeota archaeon]
MNRRRFWQISAVLLGLTIAISAFSSPAVSAAIPWASWVPTTYTSLGWVNPAGARITGRIPNFLFTSDNGNANDTILYSELLVDSVNNTILANYIDLEEATGATFKKNPFNAPVPQGNDAARVALDAAIAQYTIVKFTGNTLWDLIEFTFEHIWNAMFPYPLWVVEKINVNAKDGGFHEAILLDYEGTSGLGLVLFVNLGVKAAILFDVGKNSPWANTVTFNASIHAFVTAFLEPLAEILHAARANQGEVIASGTPLLDGLDIKPSQSTTYLNRSAFLALANILMAAFPVPSFPFILEWNQVAIIIVIIVAIGLVIYYGLSSYSTEKKKVPESQPREQPWYS